MNVKKTAITACLVAGLTAAGAGFGAGAAMAAPPDPTKDSSAGIYGDAVRDAQKVGTIGVAYDSGVTLPTGYTWSGNATHQFVNGASIPTVRTSDAGSGLQVTADGRVVGTPGQGLTESRTSTWELLAEGKAPGMPDRVIRVQVKLADPAPVQTAAAWNPYKSYKVGDRAVRSGVTYEATQNTRGGSYYSWGNFGAQWKVVG